MLNVESWLLPLADDAPCGPNLEYDKDLIALEQACQGKPEQQYGSTLVPATPPDWKLIRELSCSLLERTRDLRIPVRLAQAELHLNGYQGLGQVLTLIHGWCEQMWPTLHPQLDPADGNDPTLRINLLAELKSTELLNDLRRVPLFTSRGIQVSLRDLAVAKGEVTPTESEKRLSQNEIDGACQDVPLSDLQQLRQLLDLSLGHLTGIDTVLTDQVGSENAVDFTPLKGVLKSALVVVSEQLESRSDSAATADSGSLPEESMPNPDRPGQAVSSPRGLSGEVSSRDDVVKALDKICAYYEKHEPSSPIPLLLRRAQKLSTMNFLEILQELAPSGLTEAQSVGGIPSG